MKYSLQSRWKQAKFSIRFEPHPLKTFSLLLLIFSSIFFCYPGYGAEKKAKKVLVLSSYHPGYTWGESVVEGIRSVLDDPEQNIIVRYEYMDTKYHRPERVVELLADLYMAKYVDFHFDAIIAADNNALTFLLNDRDTLFPNTPVVFCGINGFHESMLEGKKGFTGMAENYDLRGTLELALELHPQVKNVAMVSGTSTSSMINQALMHDIFPEYEKRVRLIDLSRLNPEDLQFKLQQLPSDSIIIYLSYYKMPNGSFLTVPESTAFVYQHAKVPIYSPWEYTLGNGIVGGMMLSGRKEGAGAANYVLQLLDGTDISDIPIRYSSEITPIFDYRMLQEHNISLSSLPQDRLVLYEPQTLYYRYKYPIWGLAAFILYQSLMIFWLGRSLMRRKRAEKQQKELEAQLLHSQKMEAIGTFAGGIAHDLNNILGAISNCGELALEDTDSNSPVREDLEHILHASDRGKDLIRQILDFSRKREQEKRQVNVKNIILECERLVRYILPQNIEIKTNILSEDSLVLADPGKINQALINLCTNAEQAMRGTEGTLTITLERLTINQGSDLLSHELQSGYYACISVADTGTGISRELQSRIFEPFFTTRSKGEGTGLGLAVVHGIITAAGGTIRVESKVGEGTAFKVYLPCRLKEERVNSGRKNGDEPKGTERILLVDDDVDQLYSQQKMLERLGYGVTALAFSDRALAVFQSSPREYDLVITDQMMPQLTGVEFAREVRRCREDIPVILCSGVSKENHGFTSDFLWEAGVYSFVEKPFNSMDISLSIRRALDGERSGEEEE